MLDIQVFPRDVPLLINNIGCWMGYLDFTRVNDIIRLNRFRVFIREQEIGDLNRLLR